MPVLVVGISEAQLQRLLGRAQAVAQGIGQHAVELGQGALDREPRGGQPQALGGEQAQHQGQRLLVGEHQGWQLEARPHPVAARPAPLGLDRDAHLLEAADVAADGARGDLEPLGDLRAAHLPVHLEQLQQGQEAFLREIHELSDYIGPILSTLASRLIR